MWKTQVASIIHKSFWTALDWVYPPVCVICQIPGKPLCENCLDQIDLIEGKICSICGEQIRQSQSICATCKKQTPMYDAMRNLAFYGGVIRECIHALKYENNRVLGKYFAEMLLSIIEKEAWMIDVVLPVPLSRERLKERGYNQAAAVAKPLSIFLGLPYNAFCLEQVKNTRSQVGLSAEERRTNVINAFRAIPELVRNKNILLVDDVMTTGATIESCAKALKDAGSGKVYCVTIARFAG